MIIKREEKFATGLNKKMTERKKKKISDGWTERQKDRRTEGQRDRLIINREEEFANRLNKKILRMMLVDLKRDRQTTEI